MEILMDHLLTQLTHISPWLIYLCFFISAVLQITIPPYPGDTILIFGGYLGSIGIKAGNVSILISYLLGTIISSYALYILGKSKGDEVLGLKFISKYFSVSKQIVAQKWLFKYGILLFFVCKFVPGLNSIIILLGGVFRFNSLWALLGVGFASILHNLLFFMVGRSIGYNIEGIKSFLSAYNTAVLVLIAIGICSYFAYRRYKKSGLKHNKEIL